MLELMPEAFDHFTNPNGVQIPAATLRARLPEALRAAKEYEQCEQRHPRHEATRALLRCIRDFVRLCADKEKETGTPCTIWANY